MILELSLSAHGLLINVVRSPCSTGLFCPFCDMRRVFPAAHWTAINQYTKAMIAHLKLDHAELVELALAGKSRPPAAASRSPNPPREPFLKHPKGTLSLTPKGTPDALSA